MSFFKELLIKGFTDVNESEKRDRISAIEKEIVELKEKLKTFVGKFDNYSTSVSSEIMSRISELTIEKMNLENEILIVGSAEERAKAIVSEFNKVPNVIESFEDFDFKKLYSRAFIKDKGDIILVVGNKDVSKLTLKTAGELSIEIPYTVRISTFRLRLAVYVNI